MAFVGAHVMRIGSARAVIASEVTLETIAHRSEGDGQDGSFAVFLVLSRFRSSLATQQRDSIGHMARFTFSHHEQERGLTEKTSRLTREPCARYGWPEVFQKILLRRSNGLAMRPTEFRSSITIPSNCQAERIPLWLLVLKGKDR